MLQDAPKTIYLKDYQPPDFLIDTADLHFDLSSEAVLVRAKLTMRRNPASGRGDGPLVLHGEQLEHLSLVLDGSLIASDAYSITDQTLTIPRIPDRFTLESEVRIRPAENTALEGLYQSGGMLCTQCEAEGFRRITWFLDRPDVMTRFTTRITADKARYPVLLSNGNLVESTDTNDGPHQVTWADPFPKPSYLFALVT